MSHFAKIVDSKVVQVIVTDEEGLFFKTYVDTSPGVWVKTSYNTHGGQHPDDRPFRKNFAGLGYTYDAARDAFYAPKPFDSWTLNDDTCLWEAPVSMPIDGKPYVWNETTKSWDKIVAK
jgi:hypothetical protein